MLMMEDVVQKVWVVIDAMQAKIPVVQMLIFAMD